jgi:peptidyl-tRNA hydrolase, PTH1 family
VLAVPESYMNRSGDPTQAAAPGSRSRPSGSIVCHDDLDLEVGRLKLKRGGGTPATTGSRTSTGRSAPATTCGCGSASAAPRADARQGPRAAPVPPAERETIDVVLEEAADAVALLVTDGLEPTQNRYHAR